MANLGKKVLVDLFYDVISPYSYLSFVNFTRYSKEWANMELNLRPVYLSGIMTSTNNRPPAMVPAKGKYMTKDLAETSKYFNIDFKFPANPGDVMFTKGTINPQRLLTAIKIDYPNDLNKVSLELFRRVWVNDIDVASVESLKIALNDAGISKDKTEKLLNRVKDPEVKEMLKATTQDALNHGAFGLPTFVAYFDEGPKMFFGNERLFILADYLKQPSFPKPIAAANL